MKIKPSTLLAWALLAGLLQGNTASATTLTYSACVAGPSCSESGFTTSALGGLVFFGGKADANWGGDQITIARLDGGAFDLNFIDFGFVGGQGPLVVHGDKNGGGTVDETVAVAGFGTDAFDSDFTDLVSVRFNQGFTLNSTELLFDNVNVTVAAATLPEPGSLALALTALAGLAWGRRRSR